MRKIAEDAGYPFRIESAGTHNYHVGEQPDRRMRSAAGKRGYKLLSRGRHVQKLDLKPGQYDLVVAMDEQNHQHLMDLVGEESSHIRLFSEYSGKDWPRDVPDPYYGGEDGFEYVLDMLEAGCPRILDELRTTAQL